MFEAIFYEDGKAYWEFLAERCSIQEAIEIARMYCISNIDNYPMFCIALWNAMEEYLEELEDTYAQPCDWLIEEPSDFDFALA